MTTPDALTRELLAAGPLVRDAAPHALIAVRGADATDFLQRLCSQDVVALAPGSLLPAAFLDSKGKVVATCLAGRLDDGLWLETQRGQHERLLQLLDRFHFTEKVAFTAVASGCRERVSLAAGTTAAGGTVRREGEVVAVEVARRGVRFERWHGPQAALPEVAGARLEDDLAECLRMAAGFVRVGVDTEPTTLGLEADLGDHCSTTKGCYTGQEIVARIHTYGHTNRALCLLHLSAGPAITAPVVVQEPDDGLAVGRVMHAVPVPGRELRVGLGYLPADFQRPGQKLRFDGGEAVVAGFAAPA